MVRPPRPARSQPERDPLRAPVEHRVREAQQPAAQALGVEELVDLAAAYHRQGGRLDRHTTAVDQLLAVAFGDEDQLVVVVPVRFPHVVGGDRYSLEQLNVDHRAGVKAVDREVRAVDGRGQRHG